MAWLPLVLMAAACSKTNVTDGLADATYNLTAAPDYSLDEMWFEAPADTLSEVDVFYVAPTCIWDWTDEDGTVYHHMDVGNPDQRQAVDNATRLACALFGKHGRFFAPYYRQVTMESWMVDSAETERRYGIAHGDVAEAFAYYMAHRNGGRPFVLAGHSQGAKAVIELLKHSLTPEQHANMVAAYAIGYPVRYQELAAYPLLVPARDSLDCGVLVCFNSVSSTASVSPLLRGTHYASTR